MFGQAGRHVVRVLRGTPPREIPMERPAQFSLLVVVNALVGGMLGQELTVLPLIARQVFDLEAFTAALAVLVAFGVVKMPCDPLY